MRIIGIDPGTAITGFSIIEADKDKLTLLDAGYIHTHKGLKNPQRLNQISKDLREIVKKWKPQKASVEKLFFNKNITTGMSVSEARGVVTQIFAEHDIEICEFGPSEIKSHICGNGRADKKAVQKMVTILMGLKEVPKPDDVADAIAVAICGANHHDYSKNQTTQ
jgi:crossover junction endodeoxyribonuclease RuvC